MQGWVDLGGGYITILFIIYYKINEFMVLVYWCGVHADLKQTSSWSLFHHRLLHRYSLDYDSTLMVVYSTFIDRIIEFVTVFEIFNVKSNDFELDRFKVTGVKVHSANRKPMLGFLSDFVLVQQVDTINSNKNVCSTPSVMVLMYKHGLSVALGSSTGCIILFHKRIRSE